VLGQLFSRLLEIKPFKLVSAEFLGRSDWMRILFVLSILERCHVIFAAVVERRTDRLKAADLLQDDSAKTVQMRRCAGTPKPLDRGNFCIFCHCHKGRVHSVRRTLSSAGRRE
jgi:hypothetical protein